MILTRPLAGVAFEDGPRFRRIEMASEAASSIDPLFGFQILDATQDGTRIAAASPSFQDRNTNKRELVVWDVPGQQALLRWRADFVVDARFGRDGRHVLVHASGKKLRCLDVAAAEVVLQAKAIVPLHKAALDPARDRLGFAWPSKKGTVGEVSFGDLTLAERKMPTKEQVAAVAYPSPGAILFSDAANTLRLWEDGERAPRWQLDLGKHGALGNVWPHRLLVTPGGRRLVVEGGFDEAHPWGVEWVVRIADGEIERRIEATQGRGKICDVWSDDEAVTQTGARVPLGAP